MHIERTGRRLYVSLDNASIHNMKEVDLSLGWPDRFLKHPAHSPDLHQVIEHRFAEMKQYIVERVYQTGFHKVNSRVLKQFVLEFCRDRISPEIIQKELVNLKLCYQVVATPNYQWVLAGKQYYCGVAGGWPPKRFR
jgi:hypothetical protein